MSEWCVENEERIPLEVATSKYAHMVDLQECLNPPKSSQSVLLILNQEINITQIFLKLWNNYDLRVCADGGANRLYNFFKDNDSERAKYLPDYIVGDFDSLKVETEEYYKNAGVVIIKQETQNSTDFTKSLNLISLHMRSPAFRRMVSESKEDNHSVALYAGIHELYKNMLQSENVTKFNKINLLAIGGIDGRFDQTIHSVTQLYNLSASDSQFKLCYLSASDLIFLVPSGGMLIKYTKEFRDECIGNCGILPLAGPTEIIETAGFKWDVGNWATDVASGRVSSSNRFVGLDKCYVNVKDGVVMNVEVFIDKLGKYL